MAFAPSSLVGHPTYRSDRNCRARRETEATGDNRLITFVLVRLSQQTGDTESTVVLTADAPHGPASSPRLVRGRRLRGKNSLRQMARARVSLLRVLGRMPRRATRGTLGPLGRILYNWQ